jgi:hypothetical protein
MEGVTKTAPETPSPLDLETCAQPLWLKAARDAGLAAACRLRGEDARAEAFETQAAAAEAFAAELEARAFSLRLAAAFEARRLALAGALTAVAV